MKVQTDVNRAPAHHWSSPTSHRMHNRDGLIGCKSFRIGPARCWADIPSAPTGQKHTSPERRPRTLERSASRRPLARPHGTDSGRCVSRPTPAEAATASCRHARPLRPETGPASARSCIRHAPGRRELSHPAYEVRLVLIQCQILVLKELGIAAEHLVQMTIAFRPISVSCLSGSA